MREWLGLPVAAALEAAPIDRTVVLVHWMILVLFVGWSAFFVYTLIRFRQRAHPRADTRESGHRVVAGIEVAILALEIALLVSLSLPFWSTRASALPTVPEALVVRVIAEQYSWNVHYPGPDGRFGTTRVDLIGPANPLGLDAANPDSRDDVVSVNAMHMPVNRPVIVYLTSKDVVHGFTLREMRVKQDAIPGSVQTVWFTPVQTGTWEIACSQLCGLAHYRMRGTYTVESSADFAAWLATGGR